ncbi:hypothetical protein R1flu_003808 [Riccia fluitans]|uniref:PROP1-like PPR domain-containing protein n=1 Tax=Riccia fluitans TaxID=41844 RepID=A0ABD1YA28_9MARC
MYRVAEQWSSAACVPPSPFSQDAWQQRQQLGGHSCLVGLEIRRQSLTSSLVIQEIDGFSRHVSIQKFDDFNHTASVIGGVQSSRHLWRSFVNCSLRSSRVEIFRPVNCKYIRSLNSSSSPSVSGTLHRDRSEAHEKFSSISTGEGGLVLEDGTHVTEDAEECFSKGGNVEFHRPPQLQASLISNSTSSVVYGDRNDGKDEGYMRTFSRGGGGGTLGSAGKNSWSGGNFLSFPFVMTPSVILDGKSHSGLTRFQVSRNGIFGGGALSLRRSLSLSVSATAESVPDTSVENDDVQIALPTDTVPSSSSIPKMRKPKSMPDLQTVDDLRVQINGRRSGADPWFPKSQENSESSKKFRDSIMKKTIQRLKSEVDKSNRKLEESTTRGQFHDNNRRPVFGVGGKSRTVVPRRQVREALESLGQTATVDSVLQALDRISSTKGIANLMEQFKGELTTQDLKQILTELGTSPERNWAKALQVFDWIHTSSGYKVDLAMYHTMLLLLGKAKKMDIAESMFERMQQDGLTPGLYEYTALVAGHVRSGNLHKGIATLDGMKAAGIRPSVSTYNVLVDGCLKVPKGFEIANSLLQRMKRDKTSPDRVTFTTMIIVYSRKGHHKEAITLFREMVQQKIYPDILTYNAVLNAYGKLGDVQGMLQVHQSMLAQQVDPDTVTFNIIFSALGRAGRTKDVVRIYRHMRKIGVTPDVTTCSILVSAYGKAREWVELDSLLAEMESLGLQPDLAVYNSLISIYGKAGRFEQVDLLTKSLSSSGTAFDLITYNTLIDVYGKGGRLSDVIKWFSDMRRREVKPDVRTFNALVHAYGRASQYDGVREVLDLFRSDGSKPDLVFYHTVLFMFGKGGKYNDAWRVIDDMKAEGYTLSLEIYNSLLLVFGRSDPEEAMKVFNDMVESGVFPSSNTFKVLIEVYARKGKVDECLSIYRTSTKYLSDPVNESVLSSLFGACCNTRRTEEAEAVLSQLEKKKLSISVTCFNWLILGYGRQGDWVKAEQVLNKMRSQRLVPNSQSYTFLLEAYSLCGLQEKAEVLSRKMEQEGNLNSISACNALLRFYVRSGQPRAALEVFEDLMTGRIGKLNQSSYIGLISAYGGDEAVDEKIWDHIRSLEASQIETVYGIYTALLGAIPKCRSFKEAQQFVAALVRLDCPSEISCILCETVSNGIEEEVLWVNLAGVFKTIERNGFNLETQRSFLNALIDALWWFGWELRALRVVKMGMDSGIFGKVFSWGRSSGWTVDMRYASAGAAQILLLIWIAQMRKLVLNGEKPSSSVKIHVAERWQLVVGENKSAREALDAHLTDLGAPFPALAWQMEVEASANAVEAWLREDHLDKKLFFADSASEPTVRL